MWPRERVSPAPSARRSPLSAVLVAITGLAACTSPQRPADDAGGVPTSAAAEVEVAVLDFAQVQASDLVFEADPADPTRGIFRVETSEPMICALVWGTDETFGRFNNSLAMDGTGITDHDVYLPDVEPGRQYRFVVQGTTADGTLYRSGVGSFRIEPPTGGLPTTTSIAVGDNLALGATVADVSSEFSDTFAAAGAIDGDPSTEWSTAGDGDGGFLVLDLGEERRISAVEFVTRTMADGSATTTAFTVAVDGGDPVGPFDAGTPARPERHRIELTGRMVRIDVASSTGGNVGAIEVGLYGDP